LTHRGARFALSTVAGLLLALTTACSGDSEPAAEKAEPNLAGATCPGEAAAGTKVAFTAGDGAALVGIELGQGRSGVVLAHQNASDLCEWLPYGKQLAGKGYRVLAFDFGGEGGSGDPESSQSLDGEVVAAVEHIRSRGAGDVVLMGASKGGTAILTAAASINPAPKALVSLSAPARFDSMDALAAAPKLQSPVLYLAGKTDGDFAVSARQLHDATPAASRTILVVPEGGHGTALLRGGNGDKVTQAIEALLAKSAPPAA
jgi:pimeloyl-ACP methyl ester carboxylesterase